MPNLPISQLPLAVSGQPESWMAIVNYDVDPSGVTNKIYFSALTEQFSGSTGTSGTSGVDGSSGTSGINGTDGTSGTSGIDGSSGTSGTDGSSGSSGIDGSSGTSGTDGSSGTSGIDGSSGTSGINGTDGTSGTSGMDGSSGTSGLAGTSGSSGTSGTSAASAPYPIVYGLFSQTASTTTITGTTEQSMINGGVGTLTVGANQFQVGDSFDATFSGLITNTNNHTLRIRVEADSIILADSGAIAIASNTDSVFYLQLNFVIRAIGGTGVASIYTVGAFQTSKPANASLDGFGFDTLNNTTFDTTISNTLDVTLEFGSDGDSIQVEFFRLNKTY